MLKNKLSFSSIKNKLPSAPRKGKLQYTPSKNEFFLLLLLAIVAVSALAIHFLYLPEWTALTTKHEEYKTEKTLVETLRSEYEKIDTYLDEDAKLGAQLEELRQMIPTYLSEEEILASIDGSAASAKLDVLGITISELNFSTQKEFLAQMVLASSVQTKKTDEDIAAYEEATGHDITPEDESSTTNDISKKEGPYIKSKVVTINYKGSYESFVAFLAAFESQKRQVYFRSNATSRAEDGTISGSLTMLVFSSSNQLPSLNDPNFPGYDYQTPSVFGKANPFAAFPNYIGVSDTARSAMSSPDFYAILNTYDDNSNKIMMGKYPVSRAQVSCDKNENVPAHLSLTAEGGQCTYSYQVGEETYSDSFQLDSKQSSLSIAILSRTRKSSMDNVAMTLAVENHTALPLTVVVKYDDPSNPRFHLGTTSGNVQLVNYN